MSNKIKLLIVLPFFALICSVFIISGYAMFGQKFDIEGSFVYKPIKKEEPQPIENWRWNGLLFEKDTEAGDYCLSVKAEDKSILPENLVIPREVIQDGEIYTVTSISRGAFMNAFISDVSIPSTVKKIEMAAFTGCSNLTSIKIPEGVTTIKLATFLNCTNLETVLLPSTLESFEETSYYVAGQFTGCTALKNIKVAPGSRYTSLYNGMETNSIIDLIGNSIYLGCINTNIPEGITRVDSNAFYECEKPPYKEEYGLKYLGNDENPYLILMSVEDKNKDSYTISEQCKAINYRVFSDCTNLISINIPSNVESIADDAFSNCTSLEYRKDETNGLNYLGNDEKPYMYLMSVEDKTKETYKISDYCIGINDNVFSDCTSLTSIEIPEKVTSIGEEAFFGCTSLKSINIPKGVIDIEENAFFECNQLKTVYIDSKIIASGIIVSSMNTSYPFGRIYEYVYTVYILQTIKEIGFAYYEYSTLGETEEFNNNVYVKYTKD